MEGIPIYMCWKNALNGSAKHGQNWRSSGRTGNSRKIQRKCSRWRKPWTWQTRGIPFSISSRQTELWKQIDSLQLQTRGFSALFAKCCSSVDTRVSSPRNREVPLRPVASVTQNPHKLV